MSWDLEFVLLLAHDTSPLASHAIAKMQYMLLRKNIVFFLMSSLWLSDSFQVLDIFHLEFVVR